MKRIIIFGTGKDAEQLSYCFINEDIIAYVDNDDEKWGTLFNGTYPIVAPETLKELEFDEIYILSRKYKLLIYNQLLALGIDKKKIFLPDQIAYGLGSTFLSIVPDVNFTKATGNMDAHIWLLSNALNFSGAPIALYNLAICLVTKGYAVTMISPIDGPLREKIDSIGVETIIDPFIIASTLKSLDYIPNDDLVIVNTVTLSNLLLDLGQRNRVIWWLHEPKDYYGISEKQNIKKIDLNIIEVWSVSNIATIAFEDILKKKIKTEVVSVGILESNKMASAHSRFTFMVVAPMIEVKAPEIFAEAINIIPNCIANEMEFWLIGDVDAEYLKKKIEPFNRSKRLKILGKKTQDELAVLYDAADVQICCSNVETLSIVTIEAMQRGKTCIVSDSTGIAEYIEDNYNGFVFSRGDKVKLSEKMIWCYKHQEECVKIGLNAQKTFREKFSMTSLCKRIDELI